MRWRWWRPEPVDPDHGRDPNGKLYDGHIVRPPGWDGWTDLLPGRPAQPAGDDPTALYPVVTRGQRMRGEAGGWATR